MAEPRGDSALLVRSDAVLSDDGLYRYWLERTWDESKTEVCFVMLNPSTADASVDDPTIRRCIGFAKAWGHGSLTVVNLFGLRATDPKALLTHDRNPVGIENDDYLINAAMDAEVIVAAWGTKGTYLGRAAKVTQMLTGAGFDLHCLDITKDGHPKHPLYVKGDTVPGLYRAALTASTAAES